MILNQKEKMFLEDLKKAEQTCIERYSRFSQEAGDGVLQRLFHYIMEKEQQHLQTINQLLQGILPQMGGGGGSQQPDVGTPAEQNNSKEDQFLCDDALDSEKFTSSLYNTSVFEFQDPQVRNILNHIQKEEQEHGELIFRYMKPRGMYATS